MHRRVSSITSAARTSPSRVDRAALEKIAQITGKAPGHPAPLGGGSIASVYRVPLSDGSQVVAKMGRGLMIEAVMLRYLAERTCLPIPGVLHADEALLVMTYIPADGGLTETAQAHAADLLATLHDIPADAFGFDHDTVIGGLHQPNPWTAKWLDFFRDQRLMFMARAALEAGRLPNAVMARIETIAGRLDRWLAEPAAPSLIHGDLWTGNILCRRGRIACFIDPAIYFADAEIELAFSTLFGTLGEPFFRRYAEHRPLRPGFFEERCDLYNLYPLLVHVRLFGGSYVGSVERTLARFGC